MGKLTLFENATLVFVVIMISIALALLSINTVLTRFFGFFVGTFAIIIFVAIPGRIFCNEIKKDILDELKPE